MPLETTQLVSPLFPIQLVERSLDLDGRIVEVFEVDGEIVTVESWSSPCPQH